MPQQDRRESGILPHIVSIAALSSLIARSTPEAIREGLINAFAHRDYSNYSGGIAVHIYSNRLEIWNSGKFLEGVTPSSLMTGHISILRNLDIAHILYLREFMEKVGRGVVLIQKACADRGLPPPRWTEDDQGVTLSFFAPEVTPEVKRLLRVLDNEMSRQELQVLLGLKDEGHFREAYLVPAIDKKLVERTIPEKP